MRILLIDIDSTILNVALAKVSSYHKAMGDTVDLIRLRVPYYPHKRKRFTARTVDLLGIGKAYFSALFKGALDKVKVINSEDTQIFLGGTGSECCDTNTLPEAIEACDLDYSLWPDNNISYGFITRGCIRKCYFCVVPKKEGLIRFEKHPKDIIKHKRVKFLDNNILAYPKKMDVFDWLIDNSIQYQFIQGLDIRLLTPEIAAKLEQSRYWGDYIFAFDNLSDQPIMENKVAILKSYLRPYKCKFYIYTHPSMPLADVIYRVLWCRHHGVLPYLMRDASCWGSPHEKFYTDLSGWCNQPGLFKNLTFEVYLQKRKISQPRRDAHTEIYRDITD